MDLAPLAQLEADTQAVSTQERAQRHRGLTRDRVERLLALAEHLPSDDRVLVELVLRDGRTPTEIAAVWRGGVYGRRAVTRRVNMLMRRITGPAYLAVVRLAAAWPPSRRAVGRACVVEGRSMRAASRTLGLSVHVVRRRLNEIGVIARSGGVP